MRTLLVLVILATLSLASKAQKNEALLREIASENQRFIEALALYPQDVQLAILEASKYPAVLVKMHGMQQKTGAAFRTLLENEPRSVQETLYDLTRHPSLIHLLAVARGNPVGQRNALEVLPENQQEPAFDLVQRKMKIIDRMDELLQSTQISFETLIEPYFDHVQLAFRTLLQLPEALDILNEDLRFTVILGDLYSDDPAWMIAKMDSIHLAAARNHAQELEDWKYTIESDPEAREEFIAAGKEYARAYNGYDSYDYSYGPYDANVTMIYDYTYFTPYPYWLGYPWWRPYPYWRPYPSWYDWGYYHHHETFFVVMLPSWHFMHWYFDHPHHHHHFSHLSARFVNHYYGYRHSGTNISQGVAEWRKRTRSIISDQWLQNDDGRLAGNLRAYGKFEEDREDYNARNPLQAMNESDFIDFDPIAYPEMYKARETARKEISNQPIREQPARPTVQPGKQERDNEPTVKKSEPIVIPPAREARETKREKQRHDARPKAEPAPKEQPKPAREPEKPKTKTEKVDKKPRT